MTPLDYAALTGLAVVVGGIVYTIRVFPWRIDPALTNFMLGLLVVIIPAIPYLAWIIITH